MFDDDFEDYFEKDKPEEPVKTREETEREREERELASTVIDRRHDVKRYVLYCVAAIIVVLTVWWLWARYFHPYRVSEESGRIMEVVNEGSVFKTYEGKMVSERFVQDTVTVYTADFDFTIVDDDLARKLMQLKGSGKKVTLKYKEYRGRVPWRGASNRIVTEVKEE